MLQSKYTRERLDFDSWQKLAKEDPEAFEELRQAFIGDYIAQASTTTVRTRLSRMQWRIDRERELSANPIAACVRINSMMWESFAGEQGLADVLQQVSYSPVMDNKKAKLIPLKRD